MQDMEKENAELKRRIELISNVRGLHRSNKSQKHQED